MPDQDTTADFSLLHHPIDTLRLDVEWTKHPEHFAKFSQMLSEAKRDLDKCEDRLTVLHAELDLKIRSNPKKFGLDKITEKVIDSTIELNPDYRKLRKRFLEKKHYVSLCQGAVVSMEHRKRALENLVDLHGQSYFSVPKSKTGEGREFSDDLKRQRANERMKKKENR